MDEKSLIVSGDHQCIVDLLQQMVDAEKKLIVEAQNAKSVSRRKKQREGEQPIDIVSLNQNRALSETESTLEFIIVSLCQALSLQPKQAAGLLTNQNHYLLHACIKGVKSNYDPIMNWYQLIYATSKHLSSLAIDQISYRNFHGEQSTKDSTFMLFNALKCGFFSESLTVAEWTCKLFTRISQDFDQNDFLPDFYQWFNQVPTQKNNQLGGGFEAALYALNKHSQIVESIALLLLSTFKNRIDKLIPELKINHVKKNQALLPQLMTELLPSFYKQNKEETVNKLLYESGIIEECLKNSDPENKDNYLRAQSISLLTEVWSLEPGLIQENNKQVEEGSSILDVTLSVLKRACKDPNRSLKLSTLGQMFRLIDQFAQVRNNQAPVLYKILTFSLIESIEDDVVREYMMTSFTEIFQNFQSIPVSILIEPLLRTMQVNEKQYKFNVFDFDFFTNIAKHPKLQATPYGLQLMDQFAKMCLNMPLWAQSASVPFIILADRFQSDIDIQDFLIKFISVALTSFLSMKKAFELVSTKTRPKNYQGAAGDSEAALEDDYTKKIRRYNIITITKKILNLKISEEFNEQIKEIILQTNRKHKQLYGTMCRGLVHLLEFWFTKGKVAMDEYMKQMDEQEKKVQEDEEKRQQRMARKEEVDRIKAKYYQQNDDSKGYYSNGDQENRSESNYEGSPRNKGSQAAQRALVPWIYKEPKNPIEKKALAEIDAIKQKREEKALRQKMEEEKKKLKEEKKIKGAQEEINKRKLELGVAKGNDNNQQLVLYQPPADTPKNEAPSKEPKPQKFQAFDDIKLIDLDNEEEDRDRDGIKILLSKYQKPFKFLFNKYAMSRSQHKKIQNFEYFSDKSINVAELNKLLRDHDITQNMLNKDQLQTLVRLVNQKFVKRLDLSALDLGSYMHLMAQISFFIFNKTHSFLSPVEMLQKLINHFEKATRSRGQSTLLYEDPDITTIGDQEVLKEINKRIRDNPDLIIPEGYYKVVEKEQIFNYQLPDYLPISESQKVSLEVLDGIFSDALGFHLLEALVSYEQRIKVKPRVKQAGTILPPSNATALQYMKPIERKQFNPTNNPNRSILGQQSIDQSSQVVYKKPQLSVDLKLALYQQSQQLHSHQEKTHLQETAEVLEEILQAVEKEHPGPNLPERERVKYTRDVWNKAKEQKKRKELEDRDQEKIREEKRKKRQQELQDELEKLKEEKQRQLEDQKAQREQKEKEDKDRELKEKEELKKKYEQRKQVTEEAKKVKLEELQQKKKEEEEKTQQEKQKRVRDQKEFLIKQKEKLGQEFQIKKKEKEDAEKAKAELEQWKKERQQQVKNQMENYLKQNKDNLKADVKERDQILEFYKSPEVKEIFSRYDKALDYLFKFYASQDKKEIGFNLGNNLQNINFNEFIKFGFQTYISPTIVSNDDMVMIFRALVRERRDNMTQKEIDELGHGVNSLSYEDFKKALIRIAIIGQDLLGGSNGQRLEAKLLEQLDKNNGKPPKIAKSRGRSSVHSQATQKRAALQKQNSTANIQGSETTRQQVTSTTRKTKEQKLLEDIQKEKELYDKMLKVKIEDKRMSKPFDVSIITPKTIEGLLKFIQIQPEDDRYILDKKLNKQRIEVQGQKPNKIKKSLVLTHNNTLKSLDDNGQQAQGDQSRLEEVDVNELEQVESGRLQGIIGPDGKKENWQINQ